MPTPRLMPSAPKVIRLTPMRRIFRDSPQSTGQRPALANREVRKAVLCHRACAGRDLLPGCAGDGTARVLGYRRRPTFCPRSAALRRSRCNLRDRPAGLRRPSPALGDQEVRRQCK